MGKQGLSVLSSEPTLSGIPVPSCPHPAVSSASLGHANSGRSNLEDLRLPWKDAKPPVPRSQDHTFLLLPEGSEALRAGAGSHRPISDLFSSPRR